jgi:hypothetical protein
MTLPIQPISPLRQRMIVEMHMRKLAPKTQVSVSVKWRGT